MVMKRTNLHNYYNKLSSGTSKKLNYEESDIFQSSQANPAGLNTTP
jgi:hypothetical protein